MNLRIPAAVLSCLAFIALAALTGTSATYAWPSGHPGLHSCSRPNVFCHELAFQRRVWGKQYVGHDEPGIAFLSNKPGSGNHVEFTFTLPRDPSPSPASGRSYTFENGPAFWFGMILCDSQSYPEQMHSCRPDSNANVTPQVRHPGAAYMEMQFYPPGWVPLPYGTSCSARQWCAALNVDSLAMDPVHNTLLDSSCADAIGAEYVNFAFITKDGKAQAPANPIQSTAATYTPDPSRDLFMNSGDRILLRMHDTRRGLRILVVDETTHRSGFMTASKQNGFAQVKYATDPSVECAPIPYDFHPMYSTASARTILPWGATQDNVEFVDEIGHFDWCRGSISGTAIQPGGNCPSDAFEGIGGNAASDQDDTFCFPGSISTLVRVGGCEGGNVPGYDGASYVRDWPDGNTNLHPEPILFSSGRFGSGYTGSYGKIAFDTDLPAIESEFYPPEKQCNIMTGRGCTHLPPTDDGGLAPFYPFFSTVKRAGTGCQWALGNTLPGGNSYGGNGQYGKVYPDVYLLPHGKTQIQYQSFRHVIENPCP
ncbi:MAG TPA: hypothetical protein VFB34_06345 [Chloroflexota bacterium]|nr:hypothetical protein [Chloroflexota bacterium]